MNLDEPYCRHCRMRNWFDDDENQIDDAMNDVAVVDHMNHYRNNLHFQMMVVVQEEIEHQSPERDNRNLKDNQNLVQLDRLWVVKESQKEEQKVEMHHH